jgi:hypothetical protein
LDALADAGDFYLDKSGFFLMPTQKETRIEGGMLLNFARFADKEGSAIYSKWGET